MSDEGLYSALFWRMPIPSFVLRLGADGDLVFDGLNLLFAEYTGLHEEDIVGRRPEEMPGVYRRGGGSASRRLPALRGDRARWCSANYLVRTKARAASQPVLLTPVRDGAGDIVHVVGTFATFQQRAEWELRESRDLLRAIIDAVPTAIVGLDLEG